MTIKKEQLIEDLKRIGVKNGDLLHLKVSLRLIGKINGGADTLLEALLDVVGEEGTLVSDAFVSTYPLPLSKEDAQKVVHDKSKSYAGAFANSMVNHPKMNRSQHPIQKYAAIGKYAEELCLNHTDESGGYDLLNEMAKMDAKNLTIGEGVIGVGTTHVAIDILGLTRKIGNSGVMYQNSKGEVKLGKVNWNGGCATGFLKFIPFYFEKDGIIGHNKIGKADSILTSMKRTLEIELEKLKEDPKFFLCDDPACYYCRISWEHSEKKYFKFYMAWLRKNYKGLSFSRLKKLYKIFLRK